MIKVSNLYPDRNLFWTIRLKHKRPREMGGKEIDLKKMVSNLTGLSSKVQKLLKSVNFPASNSDIVCLIKGKMRAIFTIEEL
jgi:hypothetical protein